MVGASDAPVGRPMIDRNSKTSGVTLKFAAVGPIVYVGDRNSLDYLLVRRGNDIAIMLGQIRKAHYQLSVAGAEKPMLDALMRARLGLERFNRMGRHRRK